ncbi:glycosyltransferase [Fibrivirga algicola]|uniref:Glycosyltransferase family 2 protein n=1 Tax=Fibrivirga algicola TaxID=2950420 RepID=A0ABX0QJG8_9BACT|nr:glycosyltransferase family 2 protein [Fibrivirga algicola]ARK10161.1 glycosyl transferase family 2 [Fibrella sp. ES10-3-2-2]NID11391.1 glycosyltransferase family 2 protein [Fibrivirga algicola]
MQTVFQLLVGLFFGFLALNTLHYLFYALMGRLGRADDVTPPHDAAAAGISYRRIAVLVPAYKEDAVILESVQANLKQDYPRSQYDLIVIADSFQQHTLDALATLPVRVLPVSFEVSTVTKALNAALGTLSTSEYDIVVVADADNHLASDFLSRVNVAFAQGWRAIQGHRVAKNTNTRVAVLDAVSEEINNHIARKGYRAVGVSATIIGSGMAVDLGLMKAAMDNLTTIGGFDKELAMNLAVGGHKIGYLEKAYVYDEKVAKRAVFEQQRTRWIAAQWQFVADYFPLGMRSLLTGRWLSGIKLVQELALPKVLLLGILLLTTVVCLLAGHVPTLLMAIGLLLALFLSLALSIPGYLWKRLSIRDLGVVVALMVSFGRALFNMRKAFKSFMHTPHNA